MKRIQWRVSQGRAEKWVKYVYEHQCTEVAYACRDPGNLHGTMWFLPYENERPWGGLPGWAYRSVHWVPGDLEQIACTVGWWGWDIGRIDQLAERTDTYDWLTQALHHAPDGSALRRLEGVPGFLRALGINRHFEVSMRLSLAEYRAVTMTSILIDTPTGVPLPARGFEIEKVEWWEPRWRPRYIRPSDALYWYQATYRKLGTDVATSRTGML